ncbi:MAG: class I SAM-dependent RNA methyltransferase [Eubacterium sp.]|nr:class I SAM-dependent RNA methyltransferase [Eubacterium sp.]
MSRKKKNQVPEGPEKPFCEHFPMCGGCLYQNFSYDAQKNVKLEHVKELMKEVCPDFPLKECLESPRHTEYRNKMEFSFGDCEKDGPLTLGLHQRGSFYNVLPIYDCRIVDSDYRAIIWATLDFFRNEGIPYVHKRTHEGVLRHLLVRKSVSTGEIVVALVTSSQGMDIPDEVGSEHFSDETNYEGIVPEWEPEWIKEYAKRLILLDLEGKIGGILHIINDSLADVVKADKTVLLYGKDSIRESLLGLDFKITPFSFFKTNTTGAETLYSLVRDFVGDTTGKVVYDLYSGTGTIAQILAPVAKRVVGVEIVEEAVQAAGENAKLNGLDNCEFIAGDVLEVLDSLTEPPDVMVLDPPREGIHPKALPKLLAYGVENFVYVSCKPESLARDMVTILEAGYKPVKAVCVDMFPWTKHVETVCLLQKMSNTRLKEITLDVDMEEYHRIMSRTEVTADATE